MVILWLVLIALAVYLLVWGFAFWILAPRLSFNPPLISRQLSDETFWLTHDTGERIEACWFGRDTYADSANVLLYQHGNGELLGDIGDRLAQLSEIVRMPVLAYEYRGYGYSDGKSTLTNMREDGALAWAYLIEEGYSAAQIVVYGRSLGTSNATQIAFDHDPVRALILEVPMWDGLRVYADLLWTLNGHLLNGKRIKKIHAPTLILYAKDDQLIRPWHSRALLKASAAKIKQREGFSCIHAQVPEMPGYSEAVQVFLGNLHS